MLSALFEAFFADESVTFRALEDLRRTQMGNDYLIADADLTPVETNGASVVVKGLDLAAIHAAVAAFAVGKKRGEAREINDLSGVYVIRTPLMRFPNGLSYWIEQADDGASRVSLYSWSVYGGSDFGVNRRNVEALVERLSSE